MFKRVLQRGVLQLVLVESVARRVRVDLVRTCLAGPRGVPARSLPARTSQQGQQRAKTLERTAFPHLSGSAFRRAQTVVVAEAPSADGIALPSLTPAAQRCPAAATTLSAFDQSAREAIEENTYLPTYLLR